MSLASAVIAIGRKLVRPGNLFAPTDVRAIAAAAEHIAKAGGPRDDEDARVVSIASRMAFYLPSAAPEPKIPEKLALLITEAEAALVEKQASAGAALEALVSARERNDRNPIETTAWAVRQAERDYADARTMRDRAAARLTDARLQVDALRRAAAMGA